MTLFLHPGEYARALARNDIERKPDGTEVWADMPDVKIIVIRPIPKASDG